MTWYVDPQFKHKNIFVHTSSEGRRIDDILLFFAEHCGAVGVDYVVKDFPSYGMFHIYTPSDEWKMLVKLFEKQEMLKSLSRVEYRKE